MSQMTPPTVPGTHNVHTVKTQCWRGFEAQTPTRRQTLNRNVSAKEEKEKEKNIERESFFFLYTSCSLGINRRQSVVGGVSADRFGGAA